MPPYGNRRIMRQYYRDGGCFEGTTQKSYDDLSEETRLVERLQEEGDDAGDQHNDEILDDEEREGEGKRIQPLPDAVGAGHRRDEAHDSACVIGYVRWCSHHLRSWHSQMESEEEQREPEKKAS